MTVSRPERQLLYVSQVAPYRDGAGAAIPAGIHHGLTSTAQGLAELAELVGLSSYVRHVLGGIEWVLDAGHQDSSAPTGDRR